MGMAWPVRSDKWKASYMFKFAGIYKLVKGEN